MTPLRKRVIRELELRRKSPRTIQAYVLAVAQLASHYGRSPERISLEEVRSFLHYLITERKLSFSSCNQKLAGIRFLYREVLGQQDLDLRVPAKRSGKLPEPLSRSEITQLLQATRNVKHRVLLMTCYAAGLRVSELVHLRLEDILSQRMLIRVRQGKGGKERYTLLSPRLLEELRQYWRIDRPRPWLFLGRDAKAPLPVGTAQKIYYACKRRARIQHGHGIHAADGRDVGDPLGQLPQRHPARALDQGVILFRRFGVSWFSSGHDGVLDAHDLPPCAVEIWFAAHEQRHPINTQPTSNRRVSTKRSAVEHSTGFLPPRLCRQGRLHQVSFYHELVAGASSIRGKGCICRLRFT